MRIYFQFSVDIRQSRKPEFLNPNDNFLIMEQGIFITALVHHLRQQNIKAQQDVPLLLYSSYHYMHQQV